MKKTFDLHNLEKLYQKFQNVYPKIELSIENVPTRYVNKTPFQITRNFEHKTLDLKWASLFDEFDLFAETIGQVDNIHIQGKYQKRKLIPSVGSLNYEQALRRIKETGYSGLFTIELEGKANYHDISKYVETLKKGY
jgi:sugar phosphate isomerase/epimerase